jgi:hypothetical protein
MEGIHEIDLRFLKRSSFSKFAMWQHYITAYLKKS